MFAYSQVMVTYTLAVNRSLSVHGKNLQSLTVVAICHKVHIPFGAGPQKMPLAVYDWLHTLVHHLQPALSAHILLISCKPYEQNISRHHFSETTE